MIHPISNKAAVVSRHTYHTLLLASGHLLNDFYCNFLPILLPLLTLRLDLSLTMSGLLVMLLSVTANVLQPFLGYLMDKYNLNRLLLLAIPFGAVCICSAGYIKNTPMLFLAVGLSGIATAVYHPLGSSLLSKAAVPERLGLALSLFVAGGNIGFALAPLALVWFTTAYSLEALPLLILPSLFLSLLYYQARLYQLSTTTSPSGSAAERKSLSELLKNPALLKLNAAMGLRAWTHVAVSTLLPLLLISHGNDPVTAGIMLTLFLIGAALGGLVGGFCSDRFGNKTVIVTALTLGILPTGIFFLLDPGSPLALICLFFCGAGLQAPQPSSLLWAQKLLPGHAGIASGMMMGLSFGLGGIGTAITAAAGDSFGLSPALFFTTVLPLGLAAAITASIPTVPKQ